MAPLLNGEQHEPKLLHGVASKGSDEWLLVRHTGAVYREYECAPSSGAPPARRSPTALYRLVGPVQSTGRLADASDVPCGALTPIHWRSDRLGADAHLSLSRHLLSDPVMSTTSWKQCARVGPPPPDPHPTHLAHGVTERLAHTQGVPPCHQPLQAARVDMQGDRAGRLDIRRSSDERGTTRCRTAGAEPTRMCACWHEAGRVVHASSICHPARILPNATHCTACNLCRPIPYALHKVATCLTLPLQASPGEH